MPVLWQSSQRPMYVRTVWVGEFRHAILTDDDPYLIELHSRRRRPNSSASVLTKSRATQLSPRSDDLQDCLRKLNLVITSDKSNINKRPTSTYEDIEQLDLNDVDQDSDDDLIVKASPQPLNETNDYNSICLNMKNLRANKTARPDTELSERVLQWLDLAGKIDLLAPDNTQRMTQPRHSWPEIQKRNYNLTKSKTAIDVRKEGGRIYSAKGGDSPKAQPTGTIDRHEFYVPTSANTIENYARQSRNARITPRVETTTRIKDNIKTKSKDLKTNVMETRQKVMSERSALEKQYAELLSKKLIPDVSRNPKKQVHIFMPEMPKKLPESSIASRAESLLSKISYKSALKQ